MICVAIVSENEQDDGTVYMDVRQLLNDTELDEAVSEGLAVWTAKDDGLTPDEEVFDGEKWVAERPSFSNPGNEINIPSTPYVDQRMELVLAQMDAMTAAMAEIAPTSPAVKSLVARSADVRAAVEFDDAATMDELIAEFRSEGVSASVAGEAAGKPKLEAAGKAESGAGGAGVRQEGAS